MFLLACSAKAEMLFGRGAGRKVQRKEQRFRVWKLGKNAKGSVFARKRNAVAPLEVEGPL